MARAIDGELLELEIANIANKLAKSDAQKALMGRVMYCVEHMPTLTPPNEPMTCDGCVDCKRSSMSMCKFCIRNTELRDYYRRPPEGEEDT